MTARGLNAPPLPVRFWQKVRQEGECLVWTAATRRGYGVIRIDGRQHPAHRVAWHLERGEWPTGVLDHLCRNRACVNVEHLRDVTHKVNINAGMAPTAVVAREKRCQRGHTEFYETTLRDGTIKRRCAVCHRERQRQYRRRVVE